MDSAFRLQNLHLARYAAAIVTAKASVAFDDAMAGHIGQIISAHDSAYRASRIPIAGFLCDLLIRHCFTFRNLSYDVADPIGKCFHS
jgi:hypothetical protein